MNKFLLNISVLSLSATIATSAIAQTQNGNAPIFINPYSPSVQTVPSKLPNMVRSTGSSSYSQNNRTYTTPNRVSGSPQYDEVYNPFGAGFGRMRAEKDFFDNTTGQYYNQYDYFKLLASRGDNAGLQAAVKEVQENGVFDPAKYKEVMSGVSGSTAEEQKPHTQRVVVKNAVSREKVSDNLTQGDLPQKVHQGYDEEPQAQQPAPRKNQPIFLR